MALAFNLVGLLRRNAISLGFPIVAASLIYADYTYTLKCKALHASKHTRETSENDF